MGFFLPGLEKQCSAILLIGLLMDKAFVKTSLLGKWWVESRKVSTSITNFELSFILEQDELEQEQFVFQIKNSGIK